MNNYGYTGYDNTSGEQTVSKSQPFYDKELLWTNRKKYLGHKKAMSYIYVADIIIGLIAAVTVKNMLSGAAGNNANMFSILLIVGVVAASVVSVTCLENKKVIIAALIIFASVGIILSVSTGMFFYLWFFAFYAAQMAISLVLSKNLEYLKTQFGYPYFSEAIVENQYYSSRNN